MRKLLICIALIVGLVINAYPQVKPELLNTLQYRSLGFSRGGRATAVAGVPTDPLTYYFGSTGGGVWKTTDAGITWKNVSDAFFTAGSVGAVSVAPSDPNVIYVGTGSACPRGNISIGDGMYRSTDAGKTWKHIGLPKAGLIGRIAVHPKDHNLVYVAVLGNIFAPNDERGVYRSKDGGNTWERVLFVSNKTGAADITLNPENPRIIYAGFWAVDRKPWDLTSGSMDSGVYQSADAGDTWKRLTNGLPKSMVGKTGVTVSGANPDRVWAQIEAANDEGGLYRTDDAGQTWRRVNSNRNLQQRAWYYTHIFADPKDPNTVYALNVNLLKSIDGGQTFQNMSVPHGDNHDLWINPIDPKKMIEANDGGATISLTGGSSWSTLMNQPTAEIYRLAIDTRFPYRVYGAQQDNSTVSVPSRGGNPFDNDGIEFYSVGGGESGYIAVDPRNPDLVYAGSYGGFISRMDTRTRLFDVVREYSDSETGQRAADMKYRFHWNAPIRLSPHNADVVYHASQYIHRSKDKGQTWEVISPDLTRNDKTKQDYSGVRGVTRDNTGTEVYDIVFAFEESPKVAGLLWAGTDDGRVHLSRDSGKTWNNITPPDMPEWGCVNAIDLSAHDPGRAHIAVYRYRQNDFAPYIFRTDDYGKTWKKLTDGNNGIPANHFVRVVREDPDRKGLLYAGTEFGMYVSFDDGAHWQKFRLNLPVTPITDLMVHQKDLIVATQGRGFYILDNVTPLHQAVDAMKTTTFLFKPRETYRAAGAAANIYYYFAEAPKEQVKIDILDAKGGMVATYTGRPGAPEPPAGGQGQQFGPFGGGPAPRVTTNAGMNRFNWNLRYPAIFEIPQGIIQWGGGNTPPKVVPGAYQVKITSGAWTQTQPLEVKSDPRLTTTTLDYEEQLRFSREIGGKVKELYDTLLQLRDVKQQATQLGDRLAKAGFGDDVAKAAKALNERFGELEGDLTQLQGQSGQDALNFPGRMDNQWLVLYGSVAAPDSRPAKGAYDRYEDLKPDLPRVLDQIRQVFSTDLVKFNELVKTKGAQPIVTKK